MKDNPKLKTQNSKLFVLIYCLLLTTYCFLSLSGCSKGDKLYKETQVVMDTFCTITVVSPSRQKAEEAIKAGFAEIKRLEHLLNYFSPDSEVTAINKAAGIRPVKVSKETLDVIKKAIEIADITGGAFDPTIGPVIKLWKFSELSSNPSPPSQETIKDTLELVDYKSIKINEATSEVYLEKKGMELDLGGIAKGYAADKAIEVIKTRGIRSALVAIAGDIKGFGLKPDRRPWKIGIQNPRPEVSNSSKKWEDIFATLYLNNRAISTSGDYQRFFIKDGKRYHHILDPETGYPATSGLISVSVLAPEGYIADSLSTAVFVMGYQKGLALLESMGLDGVIVDFGKKVFVTRNLKKEINLIRKDYHFQK
jgi:thiamine biosynthesis lipoprotein